MWRLRIIAVTWLIFALVGPAIGGLVTFIPRGAIRGREIMFTYVFGSGPAWIAGIVYGVFRVSTRDIRLGWPVRALAGACAGFAGCLLFVAGFFVYTTLTRPQPFDVEFLRLSSIAGVPAGAVCALFASGFPWPRPDVNRAGPSATDTTPGP